MAPPHRMSGIGARLVERCLVHAAGHFRTIRLRTPDARAARFYRALGLTPASDPYASHEMDMEHTRHTKRPARRRVR